MKLIKVVNSMIPFDGYIAMTVFPFVFIREDKQYLYNKHTDNHETIHGYQQLELMILGVIVMALICAFTKLSWWWMFASLAIPVAIYVICWLIEILLPPYDDAYGNICFESEAIYNEYNFDYLKHRIPFSWIKYIPNKKYPYLNDRQRRALWEK